MTLQTIEFGDRSSDLRLIQPVDEHDLSGMEREIAAIRELTGSSFQLTSVPVPRWNQDLSPWPAAPVFGREGFGDGAPGLLQDILHLVERETRSIILGGYSLAGLFSLWAGYQTDRFAGVAAVSPSVWFPGFTAYMEQQQISAPCVFLSLGDREEKTRNPVMSTVGDCIRTAYDLLSRQGVACTLVWNEGNHFREPDLRCARGFAWVMNHISRSEKGW